MENRRRRQRTTNQSCKFRRKSTINRIPTQLLTPFFLSITNAQTSTPSICTPCPSTTWALKGSSDCNGYFVCVNGEPSTYLECPSGTKWNEETVSCEEGDACGCSSSYVVDVALTFDSTPSEQSDVIIVNPWYPVFDEGVEKCFNDGNQPPDMSAEFLFISELDCCSANFFWDEACTVSLAQATFVVGAMTAPNPAPAAGPAPAPGPNPWYPDWSKNTCFDDGKHNVVGSQYHYTSKAECCKKRFWWVEDLCNGGGGSSSGSTSSGSGSAPAPGPNPFYPDWSKNTCLNDGKHNIVGSQYHYTDLKECCNDRFWWVEELCNGGGGSSSGGTTGSGPAPAPGPNPFYPNWKDGTCVDDGKHSTVSAVYHFKNQQDCCDQQFWWSDTCSGGGGSSGSSGSGSTSSGPDPWYPSWVKSTCLNDGKHKVVAGQYHFKDKQTCCDAQFWWVENC